MRNKRDQLGNFELMVILALIRLGENAYGVPISEELEKRPGRHLRSWYGLPPMGCSRGQQPIVCLRSALDTGCVHHRLCNRSGCWAAAPAKGFGGPASCCFRADALDHPGHHQEIRECFLLVHCNADRRYCDGRRIVPLSSSANVVEK
jgi:hypothetical protein